MAKSQVWDIPSASLLDESDDFHEIAKTVQALVDENGPGVLSDLSLSEEPGETGQFAPYTGSDVMLSLQRHLAKDRATATPSNHH